jgi:hypothetical protein
MVLTTLAAGPVDAAPKKKTYVNNRAATRVVVPPRSFLDAGTEVQPGERKFTDYAFPPTNWGGAGQAFSPVTNIGGRVGWHPSPLPAGSWDIPGRW